MSVGVKHSDGNLNSLSEKYGFSYNNNINVTNYDFINNLNVQATPTTKLSLGLNASIKIGKDRMLVQVLYLHLLWNTIL